MKSYRVITNDYIIQLVRENKTNNIINYTHTQKKLEGKKKLEGNNYIIQAMLM